MRIKNTSKYPTHIVCSLIKFGCKGVNMDRVMIHVKNTSKGGVAGFAYYGVPSISSARGMVTVDRLVTIRLGSEDRFPRDNMTSEWHKSPTGGYVLVKHPYGGKRSPLIVCNDWREGCVAIAAHEARHIYQMKHKKRLSEVDAERFAAKRLAAFRES